MKKCSFCNQLNFDHLERRVSREKNNYFVTFKTNLMGETALSRKKQWLKDIIPFTKRNKGMPNIYTEEIDGMATDFGTG